MNDRLRTFLPIVLALGAASVIAQEPLPEGHSNHGEAFNEGPRQAGYLMEGQGRVDFPITTDSAEVRAFVNQGVAQLHVFFYFEAERSFRQASTIDPEQPMLYWGMAMANVNNAERAKGLVKVALEKAEHAEISRRERLYLDALAALYKEGEDVDDKARRQGWLTGLEKIVQEFPDDLDARAWLAMVAWQNSGKDGIGSRQAVSLLIDSVLAGNPLHPGAHHYKIHLWDGHDQTRALESAARLAESAPGIAHAWHMPGHTYTGLKRYADAAYQQEGSARVDHAYMDRDRVMPFQIHNYAHNNQWLSESLTRTGRAADAIAVARNLVDQPRDPEENAAKDARSAQRDGRRRWREALETFELWDDLLAADSSGALDWSDEPAERVQEHRALGLAAAARGDTARLDERIAALEAMVPEEQEGDDAEAKKDDRTPPGLDAALAELRGHRRLIAGEHDLAFEQFDKASSMRPEALARLLLAAGRTDQAVAKAREAVEKARDEVAPLAGLVEILAATGHIDESRETYLEFREIAREADADLPVMGRLSALLASWEAEGWEPPPLEPRIDLAAKSRIDLETVGPLCWSPFPALPFEGVDTDGVTHRLEDYRGKSLVVIFYLGGSCVHCMQQLVFFGEELGTLRDAGAEVLAIGSDDFERTREMKENDEVEFAMPLIADPDLVLFRRYKAFDDFEGMPLHGTFLIDPEGNVRYQEVSYQPFFDVEFIIDELHRVNRLLGTTPDPEAAAGD